MKAVILSAHPDDAESGCGGFAARAVDRGHEVVVLHGGPARQGREFEGRPHWEVRAEEARAAADVLGVRVEFFDWVHSQFALTPETVERTCHFVEKESPDLVLAQWPIDRHPDHVVMGGLGVRLCHRGWAVAFYEISTGKQTQSFVPNRYADISRFVEVKRRSLFCHRSQQLGLYAWPRHQKIQHYRGIEFGVDQAEAFYLMGLGPAGEIEDFFDHARTYKGGEHGRLS